MNPGPAPMRSTAATSQASTGLDALATLLAIYTGFTRASRGLMIIRDELSELARADALATGLLLQQVATQTSIPVRQTRAGSLKNQGFARCPGTCRGRIFGWDSATDIGA